MTALFVSKSATTDGFVQLWAERGVTLPLDLDPEDASTIVDARGKPVLVVDVNRELPDEVVHDQALLLLLAVNTCGGFLAERVPADGAAKPSGTGPSYPFARR